MEEIEIDLPDEDFMTIALMAHERDITFNKMCEIILKDYLVREGAVDRLYCISCGKEITWDAPGSHIC